MRKHTLIENIKLDPHTYLVTIGTEIGQFTGAVECREEDWDHESQYFGFELAEIKAEIEYARAKKKQFNAELKALTQFWRDMSATRTYNKDAFWVKKIRENIDQLSDEVTHWERRIAYLKDAYHIKITTFDSLKATRNRCKEHNHD